jgi:hypothetical protein
MFTYEFELVIWHPTFIFPQKCFNSIIGMQCNVKKRGLDLESDLELDVAFLPSQKK